MPRRGAATFTAKASPKNLWSIRTGSGNVDLRVPSDAAFDVDISSSSGSVTLGHPVNDHGARPRPGVEQERGG